MPRSPPDAPSLVAVTRRPAVRLRIAAVSAELGLPAPAFYERADDVPADANEVTAVVLDLACCCTDTGLPRLVRHLARRRSGTELVLFTPLLDRESELETVRALLQAAGDARMRVMTARDFYRDETWRMPAALSTRAALERELRVEFLAAVARTGRPLRASAEVLTLLETAPRPTAIDTRGETLLARARVSAAQAPDARATSERQRKTCWKHLRRAGQMPASSLLLVFRVLWFTKLHQFGWPTARVAELLDFASSREFRRAIRRRLGIGVRALRQVRYADALDWAARLVVMDHPPRGSTAVRTLAGALLRPVSWAGGTSGPYQESPENRWR